MPHKIEVTVVVSGAPQAVDINDHEKVEKLIHKALKDAGIKKPDLSEWGLRVKEGGEPISPEVTIAAAGILDGTTLFLDPDEGGGGEASPPAPRRPRIRRPPHPSSSTPPYPLPSSSASSSSGRRTARSTASVGASCSVMASCMSTSLSAAACRWDRKGTSP